MVRLSGQEVPIIGPWLGKIGKVNDILSTPCNVEPQIWVQAAFVGIPQLAISLYKPDWLDFRAEQYRGYRNKKRGKKFVVEDVLTGAKIPLGKVGWTVFTLGAWAQRLAWYMCVIDAGIDYSVNWTSMAYQWSGCRTPDAAWGKLREGGTLMRPMPGTYYADWDFAGNQGGILATPDRIGVPGQFVATPFVQINSDLPPDEYPPATFWQFCIYDLQSGKQSNPYEVRPGEPQFKDTRFAWKDWYADLDDHEYVFLTLACDGWLSWSGIFEVNGYEDLAVIGDP